MPAEINWIAFPWRGWSPIGTYTGDPRSGYVAPWVTGSGIYTVRPKAPRP